MVNTVKKFVVAVVVCGGLLSFWLALRKSSIHQLIISAHFQNAQDLKRGTPVCIDGVQVGSVTDVRLRPELSKHPVEVLMAVSAPYTVRIPDTVRIPGDSTVRLSAQGVLGPTIVNIDTRMATGAPIANGGVLESVEDTVTGNQAADAMEKIGNVLIKESKRLREQDKPMAAPPSK
jgi:ABC-type transporter Mla subunit MlaD